MEVSNLARGSRRKVDQRPKARRQAATIADQQRLGAQRAIMPEKMRHIMRVERRFTKVEQSPYADIPFREASSEIRNPDGSVVFHMDGIEVPDAWSQVACDVLAQKYFRRAGVPRTRSSPTTTRRPWPWPSAWPGEAAG